MTISLVLLAAYVSALVWLLWVAGKNKKRYALAKGVCSALFIAVGLLGGLTGGRARGALFALLMLALLLCAFSINI